MPVTRQPKAPAIHHPPSARELKRRRQSRARWEFYGDLGTCELMRSKLFGMFERYAARNLPGGGTVIESMLANRINDAIISVEKIAAQLHERHRDDWRDVP